MRIFSGQQNLQNINITVGTSKILSLSNHPLTCSYENESVAFIAFSSGNRMKNEVSEEKGSPCLEGVKTDVLAAENIISINWNHEQSGKVDPGNQLQIVVTDLVGRLVLPVQVFTGSAIINTTQLSSGMYSISINSGTCKISKKFIKL